MSTLSEESDLLHHERSRGLPFVGVAHPVVSSCKTDILPRKDAERVNGERRESMQLILSQLVMPLIQVLLGGTVPFLSEGNDDGGKTRRGQRQRRWFTCGGWPSNKCSSGRARLPWHEKAHHATSETPCRLGICRFDAGQHVYFQRLLTSWVL